LPPPVTSDRKDEKLISMSYPPTKRKDLARNKVTHSGNLMFKEQWMSGWNMHLYKKFEVLMGLFDVCGRGCILSVSLK
jgi:hypothetical protein